MKITPWLIGTLFSLCSATAWCADPINASSSGSVIGDEVLYSIGGGSAVAMGSAGNMRSIQVDGGWSNNLVGGNMSMTITLENQLNGASTLFALMITRGCIKNYDWG